jgi:hypothetical protein
MVTRVNRTIIGHTMSFAALPGPMYPFLVSEHKALGRSMKRAKTQMLAGMLVSHTANIKTKSYV